MLPSIALNTVTAAHDVSEVRLFVRRAVLFLLIGAALYTVAYAASERLISRYGHRNRFFVVRSTPPGEFQFVLLGASHAVVFDYRDMNAELERMTGARIMNLSVVGGGVAVNALLLDYFLSRHRTSTVVYVVDSFAFYSPEWNEQRLRDTRLFARAPFDPALVALLLEGPAPLSVGLDYMMGFSKINNNERFAPDIWPDEGSRFERRYRPVAQLDEERLAYLYPAAIDPMTFERYVVQFDTLIRGTQARGIEFIVIKPPIPERIRRMIPGEAQFDSALKTLLDGRGVELHDFSNHSKDAAFMDTDHLNRAGVMEFFQTALAPVLARKARQIMSNNAPR